MEAETGTGPPFRRHIGLTVVRTWNLRVNPPLLDGDPGGFGRGLQTSPRRPVAYVRRRQRPP